MYLLQKTVSTQKPANPLRDETETQTQTSAVVHLVNKVSVAPGYAHSSSTSGSGVGVLEYPKPEAPNIIYHQQVSPRQRRGQG